MTPSAAAVPPLRGALHVFLGAAPGVGKTFAMLQEAHRVKAQGRDVVVAWIQTYGRPLTVEAATGLEQIPPRRISYRGIEVEELDLAETLRRRPQIALVDELAHTNVPACEHQRRWEDVEQILAAGIDVWTTVNIQHIESLRDVVEQVTGISVRETVPDSVPDGAQEIMLADVTPEALRKRMRHGNIYPLDRVEVALNSFFREGNLAALRELAILYVVQHRSRSAAAVAKESAEKVLIVITGDPISLGLIRRGVRMGRRLGAPVTVLAIERSGSPRDWLVPARELAEELGAAFAVQGGTDQLDITLELAEALGATHLVVPAPGRGSQGGSSLAPKLLSHLGRRHLQVIGRRLGTGVARAEGSRPDPSSLLASARISAVRGGLRLYLGYAPGVGKTTRLLEEASRRQRRGAEVVVATAGGRGRPAVAFLLSQLNVIPALPTGGLDVEAVLRRNPSVVCVDDLEVRDLLTKRARYQQVRRLLNAGINVVGTVDVIDLPGSEMAHDLLDEFRDEGPGSKGTVSAAFLDEADEIELVDLASAELRDRIRSGWIADPARTAAALAAFREDLLDELRTAALRRVAGHTEKRLQQYIASKAIRTLWPVQERVAVALTPRRKEEAIHLLGAGVRMARREDATVVMLTVVSARPSPEESGNVAHLAALAAQRGVRLVPLELAGSVASTLLAWAAGHQVTAIIMPAPVPRRRLPWDKPVALEVIEQACELDVHILGHDLLPLPERLA